MVSKQKRLAVNVETSLDPVDNAAAQTDSPNISEYEVAVRRAWIHNAILCLGFLEEHVRGRAAERGSRGCRCKHPSPARGFGSPTLSKRRPKASSKLERRSTNTS